MGNTSLGFAEWGLNTADFPFDYSFGDGRDDGFYIPNLPLRQFADAEDCEQAEKADDDALEEVKKQEKSGCSRSGFILSRRSS